MASRSVLLILFTALVTLTEAQLQFPPLTTNTGGSAATTTGSGGATQTNGASTTTATDSSNYPVASVPPTKIAPFMLGKSNLPENFIFILVGCILGFSFMTIFLWRAILGWNIKRTAKRANFPYYGVKKGGLGKLQKLTNGMGAGLGTEQPGFLMGRPQVPFYSQGPGSDMSLQPLKNKDYLEQNRSSLFYSPTAGVGLRSDSPSGLNRSSAYLPAGYYAPGKAPLAAPVTASGRPISTVDMTNRTSQHFPLSIPKTRRDSPDSSPLLRARGDVGADSSYGRVSQASLDTRGPSAFMEELFDADPDERHQGRRSRY